MIFAIYVQVIKKTNKAFDNSNAFFLCMKFQASNPLFSGAKYVETSLSWCASIFVMIDNLFMWDTDNTEVDGLFGDDAWFLSWLWIAVQETKEVPKQEPKVDDAKKSEAKQKKPKKKVSRKMDFSKTPWASDSDATVVKKAEPKPKNNKGNIAMVKNMRKPSQKPIKKKSTEVDDLIKKKSGSGYMGGIEGRSTWTAAPWRRIWWSPRGNRPRPWWRWWWGRGRGGPWRGRTPHRRVDDGKLQLWRTSFKITTSTKDIIANKTKTQKTYKVSENLKRKETVQVGETITVKEFSEKMWVPLWEVMKVLLANKIIVAAQASIDFDTAQLVGLEFEVTVERETIEMKVEDVLEANLEAILSQDKEAEDLVERPPVVTVMGHVDHGKTRLLDHLRKSDVVWGEAWGITQWIWASQIVHNDKKITFIDTPWHELFSAIRARGSKITNIVIIVVAADDGVKPQTVEAIRHAKDAGAPIIVAITKIDLGNNNMERIKGQLAEQELTPEDRGGDTMIIPCSAVSWQWIDDLLDAILLQAEMLHLQYSPSRPAVWVVIESNKSAQQWVMTTMLVMTGTLRIWDIVAIHDTYGKVKRMTNRWGDQIKEAHGGDAVMILWVSDVPEPGRLVEVMPSEKEANKKISAIQEHQAKHKGEVALQSVLDRLGEGEQVQLKLILKADSSWGLEAMKQSLSKVKLEDNVELKVIHDDVWWITDSDLSFAKAWSAVIIGYNLPITWAIRKKSDQYGVTVKQFDIIYEFIEYLEDISKGLIEIEKVETLTGKMEVLALFFRKGKEMIVWGKITEGKAVNQATFKIMKGEDQRANGKILSLQKEQNSVKEVKVGHECGIKIKGSKKVEIGDVIEFYTMQEPDPEILRKKKAAAKKKLEEEMEAAWE